MTVRLPLSRRGLLRAGALSAVAAPALSLAAAAPARAQGGGMTIPGYYRTKVGDIRVTVISDGALELPSSVHGVNADPAEVQALLEANFLNPAQLYNHTNITLIETGEEKILLDTGSGDNFQPTAGRLQTNLEAAGYSVEDITKVIFTHAHPDHCWGTIDDFLEEARFPNATYAISETEWGFWTEEGKADQVPDAMKPFVLGAARNLNGVADSTEQVAGEAEVAPGVHIVPTPGHTLGHVSVRISSGDQQLLATGDALNHGVISFQKPGWHFGFDMDAGQAVETRTRLLDMAATDRMRMLCYHCPFPGLGYVARDGDAYRFVPEAIVWEL